MRIICMGGAACSGETLLDLREDSVGEIESGEVHCISVLITMLTSHLLVFNW